MTNNHPETLYKITISEMQYDDFDDATVIYEQIVEQLDIKAVIDAVNSSPAKRTRTPRSKKRMEQPTPAVA